LKTDADAYSMIKNDLLGGIATISHRHAAANKPLVSFATTQLNTPCISGI